MKPVLSAIMVCVAAPAAAASPSPRVVTFQTDDGVRIVGDYYAPEHAASPVAILLHMYRSDRSAWKPLVPFLRDKGFAVLAIDLRGHGDSVSPESMHLAQRVLDRDPELFKAMHRDVAAAVAFLSRQPDVDMSRVALVGASVGCSVAIDYAARDRSVDVVVCMTPGQKYLGVDSMKHIQQYGDRPILLLATEGERTASDKLGQRNKAAMVRIVGPGTVHGTRMFGRLKGIEKLIALFLADHIGNPVADKPGRGDEKH